MSDASRTQLIYALEGLDGANFDRTPVAGAMNKIRYTKSGIDPKNSTVVSDEIRTDRSRSDLLLVGIDVGGDVDCEFSYSAFDDFLEATLCGTWSTAGDVVFANGTTAVGSTNLTSLTASFVAGDVGKVVVAPAAFPAGTYIVSISSGTVAVVSNPATSLTSGTLAFTIKARTGTGNVLQNATTDRSFLVEQGHLDIAQFFQYTGMVFNTMSLDVTARQIVKANFGFMGSRALRTAATIATSTVEAPTFPPITAGPQITGLDTNTGMTGVRISSVKLEVNNNLRPRPHVQAIASDNFGRGPMDITGTLECYFKTGALFDVFVANAAMSLTFTLTDPLTNPNSTGTNGKYTFVLPKVKITETSHNIPGLEADGMETMGFRALVGTGAIQKQIQISRT